MGIGARRRLCRATRGGTGLIDGTVAQHPEQAGQFRAERGKLLGFFVGQVMKATDGTANPRLVNELLKEALGKGEQLAQSLTYD